MNIGDIIKNARLQKGYTQEELGLLIGVQKSAVAKYENGRVINIKRSVLSKISKVLDIPPIHLVSDIESQPVEAANKIADIYLDPDLMNMIEDYNLLDASDKEKVREYIQLLRQKNTGKN